MKLKLIHCCEIFTTKPKLVIQMNKKKLMATMSLLLGLSYGLSLASTGISIPSPFPIPE
jgi:hypothetical protein